MKNNNNESIENAKKVAGKVYDVSDYKSNDPTDKGIAITHEQVSDDYMEGTIDAKIDKVNNDGVLKSHKGKEIPRRGYFK
ncbi:YozQ family protein [Paraliobacillus sp. X-1268]|uniref:YozQ family protein n=1 Tax=Paraliobacillus sp. X-1268 TaxID=2213193 RepID=UPI000E3BDB5A|nr:YozQ family protein [Paraliobacillus sp. X-1268]